MDLKEQVQNLLKVDPTHSTRVASRENSKLEFKESFNWNDRARYAKTMAAFANNVGGFIVFGVRDSPRDIIGIDAQRFDDFDPARVTEYLNSTFAPELNWEMFRLNVAEFDLGVISVTPTTARPTVCLKNDASSLREADIYYRYRGRSERIRYPELQTLLIERQNRERDKWLEHLSRVARVGIDNVGLLDFVHGELSTEGGRLLIDEKLLDQIQFIREIREGHFTENESGKPTLRLIGDVDAVDTGSIRNLTQPLVIGEKELLLTFLRQEQTQAPAEYIKQACREASSYLPVYYFARAANLGLEGLRTLIIREGRDGHRLLSRIEDNRVKPVGSLVSETPSSSERRAILSKLRSADTAGLRDAKRVRLFEAVTHFDPSTPPRELFNFIAALVENELDTLPSTERTLLRKAVSHLDEVLYRGPFVASAEIGTTEPSRRG